MFVNNTEAEFKDCCQTPKCIGDDVSYWRLSAYGFEWAAPPASPSSTMCRARSSNSSKVKTSG